MPTESDYAKCIPKLYRRKYEDIAMLFFVEGQKSVVPTITIEQALYNFAKFTKIDDFDVKSASVTLSRLRAEFIDLNYGKATETDC